MKIIEQRTEKVCMIVVVLLMFFCFGANDGFAQGEKLDTTYISTYKKDITARIYGARRYATIHLPSNMKNTYAKFVPNTTFNIGIGATYKSATLNLGYGIPGINQVGSKRGKTDYLDVQAYLYPRKFAVDFYGQYYNGFYLRPKGSVPGNNDFHTDEHIRFRFMGGSGYYILNHNKFSFRSILAQDEWQIKSAGSFLAGMELFYGVLRSDTGIIIPSQLPDFYGLDSLNRIRFLNFGPGVGYAYNYVYRKNYFASIATTINLTADFVKEQSHYSSSHNSFQITPNFRYRISVGYNSRRWAIVGTFTENNIILKSELVRYNYRFSAGQYRLSFVRRFTPNKRTRKLLEPIDHILEYELH